MSGHDKPAFVKEIEQGHKPQLHKVQTHDANDLSLAQAKVLNAVHGEHKLKHVDTPTEGVSDAVKQAYLEEKQGGKQE